MKLLYLIFIKPFSLIFNSLSITYREFSSMVLKEKAHEEHKSNFIKLKRRLYKDNDEIA